MPIKDLLVPVDVSPPSRNRLEFTLSIAAEFSAQATAVALIPEPFLPPYVGAHLPAEVLRPVEARSGSGWALMQPADALELVVEPAADREGVPALRLTVSPEACKGDLIGARDRACRSGAPERPGASTAETIRHAALEALGSLALIPARIAGRYLERNADAALRCALLRKLLEDRRNWRLSGPASDRDGLLAAAPLAWAS